MPKVYNNDTGAPLQHMSSANTLTAASSRIDLNDISPEHTAVSSNVDLPKTMTTPAPESDSSETLPSNSSLTKAKWHNQLIDTRYTDWIVLMYAVTTGLTDSAMFANFSVFTSMQSGNTIFLALGTAGQTNHPFVLYRVLFSLISYSLGCYLFGILHEKLLGPKTRRVTMLINCSIQVILVAVAATLIQVGLIGKYSPQTLASSPREQWDSLAPICLLSFQAGGQILMARSLGRPQVPTIVATTMLCELFADPNLCKLKNTLRNLRILAWLAMLLGAIIGTWADKSTETVQAALYVALGIKVLIPLVLCFTPVVDETLDQEKTPNRIV